MKKIVIEIQVDMPETLKEAVEKYGEADVFSKYTSMLHITNLQKIRGVLR